VAYIPDIIPAAERERYARGNMGKRVGWGARPALLVVDMTRAFTEDRFPLGCTAAAAPCIAAIRTLLDAARPAGWPVFFTRYADFPADVQWGRWLDKGTGAEPDSLMRHPEAHQIAAPLAPGPGEVVLVKTKPSAFFGTPLASQLTYLGVDTVVVTGMVTSGCVRATAVDAFSHNLRVIVPLEAVADRSATSHQVNLFDIDMKYGDVVPVAEVLAHLASSRRGPAPAPGP
jgi:nicotinamidase-related amidase